MAKILISLFFCFYLSSILGNDNLIDYFVIEDKNFTLEKIINKNIEFKKNAKINTSKYHSFWFKINRLEISNFKSDVYINLSPDIDVNLYFFDLSQKKWNIESKGKLVSNKDRHNFFKIKYNYLDTTPIYFHLKTHNFGLNYNKFKPEITIEKAETIEKKEQILFITWISTLIIICLSILNIFIDFTILRERTHTYYIITLIGCIIYITSFHRFFNLFTETRIFKSYIYKENSFNYLDLNGVLTIFSLILIMYGLSFLTSKFLSLKKHSPKLYQIQKYLIYFFISYSVFSQIISLYTNHYYQNDANKIINISIIILILFNLYLSFYSLKFEKRNAKIFIIANIAPFIIIIFSAFYLIFTKYNNYNMMFLPYLGMVTFSISFSIAISIRTRIANIELHTKEIKNKALLLENEKINLQKDLILAESKELESKLALEKAEMEKLQLELDFKHREMVSSSLNISQKNELLDKIKKELNDLKQIDILNENQNLKNINNIIKSNSITESNWESFKIHFEQVHPNFFKNLLEKKPNLTQYELKLCAYLELNLSNKEIAAIQNIDPNSVKRAKIRLKHKLNLDK